MTKFKVNCITETVCVLCEAFAEVEGTFTSETRHVLCAIQAEAEYKVEVSRVEHSRL